MKIIALKGRHDCGKSETIGIHLRELLTGIHVERSEWWKIKDNRDSILYKGKTIDICPPGDSEDIVCNNIAFIEEHPCDVAFTATRSRGRGCWALDDFAKEIGAELNRIKKSYNDDLNKEEQTAMNKALAENLLKMI